MVLLRCTVKEDSTRLRSLFAVEVEHRVPVDLPQVDRVKDGVCSVEQLVSARLDGQADVPGRVSWRRHDADMPSPTAVHAMEPTRKTAYGG